MDENCVKVNCDYCGKEIECPNNLLETSKSHMCHKCFKERAMKGSTDVLKDVHVDIPIDDLIEDMEKLALTDPSKTKKADNAIQSLKRYIREIKEISKPFIPAKTDPNQTIVLKAMFKRRKGIWRKIEMKATDTMKDLHEEIQDAVGWDDDHMYSFFMDNKTYSKDSDMEVTCPFEPDGKKTADKTPIGIFGLKKGQKFAYLFDFGDDHEFEIEVSDFGTVEKGKKYPALIESKGKAPEQYPEYGDED